MPLLTYKSSDTLECLCNPHRKLWASTFATHKGIFSSSCSARSHAGPRAIGHFVLKHSLGDHTSTSKHPAYVHLHDPREDARAFCLQAVPSRSGSACSRASHARIIPTIPAAIRGRSPIVRQGASGARAVSFLPSSTRRILSGITRSRITARRRKPAREISPKIRRRPCC
ncbi:hypothetical protein BD309DRAFT_563152 [Dichomitus squalens]|nr:hypothetical protein BD309DRAFT_563152 [Dichomitus squalens]